MPIEFPLPKAHRLGSSAKIYIENRAAIEFARNEARRYLASHWRLVEGGLAAPPEPPSSWSVKQRWQSDTKDEETIYGLEYWADRPPKLRQMGAKFSPTIRVQDARGRETPGTQLQALVGFWYTDVGRAYAKQHANSLDELAKRLGAIASTAVQPHKEDWVLFDVRWSLRLASLQDDAMDTVARITEISNVYEGFLLEVATLRT